MFTVLLSFIVLQYIRIKAQNTCNPDGSSATYSEQIMPSNNVRKITSSGCPNHPHPHPNRESKERDPSQNDHIIKIPATPCFNENGAYNLSETGAAVGILLNGVSVFTAWTNRPNDPDAIESESIQFDGCGGHPTGAGIYHVHMSPACLLHQLNAYSNPNSVLHGVNNLHSPQIGWAYDGFPIFGPHGINGKYARPCTHQRAATNDYCLDGCNGHTHDIGDNFGELYHYHITGPVGDMAAADLHTDSEPTKDMFPYTIGCLKGVPNSWSNIAGANQVTDGCDSVSAVTSNYIATASNGVTDKYVPTPWRIAAGEPCTFDEQCESLICKPNGSCKSNPNSAVANDEESEISEHNIAETDENYEMSNELWIVICSLIGFGLLCFGFVVICCVYRKNIKSKRSKEYSVAEIDNEQHIVTVDETLKDEETTCNV